MLFRSDGHVRMARYDVGSVAGDVPLLAEQGHGSESGIEGHAYHLGTFGDEDAAARVEPVAQLRLGERGEYFNLDLPRPVLPPPPRNSPT